MSAITDTVSAELEKFQRKINSDVAHNQAEIIRKLTDVLRKIVYEYDQTYDAECDPGSSHWTAAASIPVEVMEEAKRLLA